MAEGKPAKAGDLNYSGYYDWNELYSAFGKFASVNQLKIFEDPYKDKTTKDGFTEREFKWHMEKKVDRMHKYIMKLDVHMWDCQQVEVTKDGVTKKMELGRMRIQISSILDDDWQGIFDDSPWGKFKGLYKAITGVDTGLNHEDYWCVDKMFEFQDSLKKVLGLDNV